MKNDMQNIQRILVPTDFSPLAATAFAYALRLADDLDAELQLLHAVYPPVAMAEIPSAHNQLAGQLLESAENSLVEFANKGLAMVGDQLKNVPVVHKMVEMGGAVPLIKNIAAEGHFDLVIMATHGADSFWDKLFGTNAAGVLQNAPCPVLVIPPKTIYKRPGLLCYATDLNGHDVLFGKEVVELFFPLLPDLHFLHVSEELEDYDRPLDFELILDLYQRQNVPFQVDCTAIEEKNVAAAILDFAQNIEAELLVMSRPHYGLFEQLFHKSYTREVVMQSPLPLLVLPR